jgi:signal transduction histidine kinase
MEKHVSYLSMFSFVIVGFGIALMVRRLGYESPYYAGLNLVYLATVIIPWGAKKTLFTCGIIYSFYLIPILLFDYKNINLNLFVNNNQFQIFTIIISTTISFFSTRTRQTEILNRLTIQKQSEELKVQEEEKRQFIANITHDLKTPLSIISGHTDILRDSFVPNTVESKYLDYIGNSITQMNRLLDMLISMALLNKKDEKPTLELFDYPLFVKEFCDHFSVQGENRGITFSTEIVCDKTVVAIDNIWVERIIGNLIQNSFKFTNQGGSIQVKMYKDKDFVFTEVTDSGSGIPLDKLSFVFNRKFQAHDDKKHLGYGLGLAIVKEMVSRLGGSIEAFSKLGEGTAMRFSLPIHCNQFASVKNSPFAISERRSGLDRRLESRVKIVQDQIEQEALIEKITIDISQFENKAPSLPTILICEDNHGQLHLLIEGLKDNFNLIIAENGREGLVKLELYRSKIDLIISDVRMPEMDGIEFCKHVFAQEVFQHLPFIFLTAHTTDKEQLEGLSYGATDYLQKPFNRSILIEKLNHWLSRRGHEQILENLVSTLETKNDEISKLRSIISHEIRNPLMILNSVHYNFSKLKNNYYDDTNEKEKKYWESLPTIFKVIETINSVLDSARIIETGIVSTSLQREPVSTILDKATEETAHLLYSVRLQINNPFKDEYVTCDKQLLTQVFVNIIRNAREAIDDEHLEGGLVTIDVVRKGNHFHFGITDNGAGIPKDNIDNLFQYRYTTKKDGTGIGLYFSKRILKVHEGDILVESQIGKGTTFTVVLPRDATHSGSSDSKNSTASSPVISGSITKPFGNKLDNFDFS